MKSYLPKGLKSNYDKYPVVQVAGHQDDCICGWDRIVRELKGKLPENSVLAVECYQGVFEDEVAEALVKGLGDVDLYRTGDFMKSEKELYAILGEDITDDRIFGFITRRTMDVYFDEDKVAAAREKIRESAHARPQVVLGVGASYVCLEWGLLAYLDMARWEIQQRFRKNLVSNVGFANRNENAGLKYKQGFFVDWRICDRWKKKIIRKVDYFIDTNAAGDYFAAGFLYGHVRGCSLETCGRIGAELSGNIIQVVGTKLEPEVWDEIKLNIKAILSE